MSEEPFAVLAQIGVVPVIAIERASDAIALADALLEGGLRVAEITFRTSAAAESLALLRDARPELLIGAGTVLDVNQVQDAVAAGARFGLAPGFDPEVVLAAAQHGLPFAPGVMTPSDLGAAAKAGIRLAKFFPAGAAGGPSTLQAIAAPFAHLNVRYIPTGGISLDTMQDWLKMKAVAAVGGTWIARTEDIREGKFAEITRKAKAAVTRAAEIRSAA
ncbi:MAG: bifunctional 4-hydroxy-2-oxoglutarate aldolase/2-dehydro-3-deoxy-phosphogluconate aldolase [Burkholderiaceae bacterium]|jgi:2-dehydro-3-deoxyphosphogluconate aldolase/(4S)-4-hydroxy-2-oxoglutarate aldolase|nr:bifunctional 4-hydroxy-2-oxoglutarate aldolase/2-dehydro-3-deoxy-phosphogluconate aldolase [Burkholderiaceae bacterium]